MDGRRTRRVAPARRRASVGRATGALSPLGLPPASLAGFPARQLRKGTILYRIHRADRSPWWFSSDGSGRFDLVDDPARGTCYLAEDPLGSFVEVFRDVAVVAEEDVAARVLSRIPARAFRLADCTDGRARRFGITAAIHSSEDYARTQAWAAAFASSGFDGIRYLVGHDPRARLAGVALFGPRGEPRWARGKAEPIDRRVLRDAERLFGIRVLPAPPAR